MSNQNLSMSDYLMHYGVKGMHWGVRKKQKRVTVQVRPGKKVKASGGYEHQPSADAIQVAKIKQKAKKSTTDSLSDAELRRAINRMNMEKQYSDLNPSNGKKVRMFMKKNNIKASDVPKYVDQGKKTYARTKASMP